MNTIFAYLIIVAVIVVLVTVYIVWLDHVRAYLVIISDTCYGTAYNGTNVKVMDVRDPENWESVNDCISTGSPWHIASYNNESVVLVK